MIYIGLIIDFLALLTAAVYATSSSGLALIVSILFLVIGAGLALPEAVKPEREEKV